GRAPRRHRPHRSYKRRAVPGRDSSAYPRSASDLWPHRSLTRRGGFECGTLQPSVGGVQPTYDRVEAVELGVDHQREVEVHVALLVLEAGATLQQLHETSWV